ncbi:MAG TPA: hypothetical protein ENN84_05900 [Candidatus Marinimicrobia bacterium]|nr:hypothetical protein [Candidatus Neomarinimicrobiota bacterium]
MFDLSAPKILIAFLLLLVMSLWSWRFLKYSAFPKSSQQAIITLRWLSIILLLLLWFRFEYTFHQTRFEKPQIAVVIDNSQSMNFHGNGSEALIESIRTGPKLSFLRENALIHWYAGYDEAYSINYRQLNGLSFEGNYTNLAALLKNVVAKHPSGALEALILISDGQSGVGIPLPELQLSGFEKLIVIGVGDTLQDFLPKLYPSQNKIFASDADSIEIRFTMENPGAFPLSGKIFVSFESSDEKMMLPVNLDPGRQERFKVTFGPQKTGNTLTVWKFQRAGFDSLFTLKEKLPVTIRPYLYNLTLISDKPNPDAAFVREILRSDQRYLINNILLSELTDKTADSDLLLLFIAPGEENEILSRYSKSIPHAIFYQNHLEKIEWVEGYLMEAFYPFLLTGSDLENSQSNWRGLPPTVRSNKNLPGQKALISEKPPQETIISFGENGIYWGIQGMWRWNLAGYEKNWENHYRQHILKSVEWLLRQDQRKILQWKDGFATASRYETVTMPLIANLDEDTLKAKSRLVISVLDSAKSELWRQDIKTPKDENIIQWRSEQAGKFHLAAAIYSENTLLASDSAQLKITDISPEYETRGCDVKALRKLAEKHSGFFYYLSANDTIDYRPPQKKRELQWRFDAGADYRFLLILLIPAIAEWIIRKRNGGI